MYTKQLPRYFMYTKSLPRYFMYTKSLPISVLSGFTWCISLDNLV
jgi:hypothetical protein